MSEENNVKWNDTLSLYQRSVLNTLERIEKRLVRLEAEEEDEVENQDGE